jgi:CheY-like chemotaxis protein
MKNKRFILLIDDDDDDQELFKEAVALVDPATICKTIDNVKDGLAFLYESDELPDYIFLDLNLPVMNGKQCLCELKKSEKLKNIPVIIYSTSRHDDDVEETAKLGAEFFIQKPTLFEDICEVISTVMKQVDRSEKI